MSNLIRFFLRLDKAPIDNLARVIVDNDQKVIVSKDGVVSIDMENPAVQEDLVNLIKGFKDISIEAPRHRGNAV
ncbi:hypothetical protein D6R50_06515 [Aeromonas veronii]|uniref:Uncharacterized protein n=1 Tax=Aeromonas veronii TaxID=654 RepID=A0A3A9I3L6_AERVE|nr:hypothetical protein [Aeromonas veronii]RKJ84410.1 hypothetical protein D6R50_22400 [Aeromonas veronii]RKJ92196.1 hypothetical protein D6R50_06515 [Aeromonas veronii]